MEDVVQPDPLDHRAELFDVKVRGWASGAIVTAQGVPISQCRVAKFAVATRSSWGEHLVDVGASWTDAEGRFRAELTYGPTWLALTGEGEWTAEPVLASPGDESIRIVATPRPRSRVKVLDANGAPVPGATVSIRSQGDLSTTLAALAPSGTLPSLGADNWRDAVRRTTDLDFSVRTNADGVGLLPRPNLDVGLILRASPPSTRDDLFGTEIDPFEWASDRTIQLAASGVISGTVVDSKGRPFVAGRIVVDRFTSSHDSIGIANDGTFEIAGLRLHTVELEVESGRVLGSSIVAKATVPAGSRDVRLVVDTGGELELHLTSPGRYVRNAYLSVEGDADGVRGTATVPVDEWGTLLGLREGERYTLWVPASDDARAVYRTGFGLRDGPLTLEATPGKTLDVDVRWVEGVSIPESVEVAERGVRFACDPTSSEFEPSVELDAAGAPTGWQSVRVPIRDLPEGTWRVRVSGLTEPYDAATRADAEAHGSSKVRLDVVGVGTPGTPLRLVLEPPKPIVK